MPIDFVRAGVLALFLAAGATTADAAGVELVSKADPIPSSAGLGSGAPALSADGRWIAFASDSPNLAPGQVDRNESSDVFLHDRVAGTTTLLTHAYGSPNTAGSAVHAVRSSDVQISADGRFVAFSSTISNLVPGLTDYNFASDVFLYDRVTETLTLVSHAAGNPGASADGSSFGTRMSADGDWIAFTSLAQNIWTDPEASLDEKVFLWHRPTGALALVSHRNGSPAAVANNRSRTAGISADGSFVVFTSNSSDLVPGNSGNSGNGADDVFVYQRSSGTVSLVSHASGSPTVEAGGTSSDPHISADGRWIAFASTAPNLVAGQIDLPSTLDAFLFDRVSGEMQLASHTAVLPLLAGGITNLFQSLQMSADGTSLVFTSTAANLVPGQVDVNGTEDLFLYDRVAGTTALVSHVSGQRTTATVDRVPSWMPSLSADGRFIAFTSQAQDLVPGQTGVRYIGGVFLYDRSLDTTVLVSHHHASATTTPNDAMAFPEISADGGVVAFIGSATDLLEGGLVNPDHIQNLFLYSRASGEVVHLSRSDPASPVATPLGPSTAVALSRDGNAVLFLSRANGLLPGQADESSGHGDKLGTWDVFLRDRKAGKTVLLSRSGTSKAAAAGGAQKPVLSADGRFAAFVTTERLTNPVREVWRLFLYDRTADALTLVNHAPGSAGTPDGAPFDLALSADGRYLAFACQLCALLPGRERGDSEVYVYDRVTGTHTLATPATGGDGLSLDVKISADGRIVGFRSYATNLVPGQTDSTDTSDLFLFDRTTGKLTLASHGPSSATGAKGSVRSFGMSSDGRFIPFSSAAGSLVPGQIGGEGAVNVFLHDRVSGKNVLVSHALSSTTNPGNQPSFPSLEGISISDDGRFTVYPSEAGNLVAGDDNFTFDIFLYDRITGTNTLLSTAYGSAKPARSASTNPVISPDGSRVAFRSTSRDLVPPGTLLDPWFNLIVLDRRTGNKVAVGPVHWPAIITPDPLISFTPQFSGDGRFVAFTSEYELVPGDFNDNWDVFLADNGLPPSGTVPLPACTLLDTRRRADRPVLTSNVQRNIAASAFRGACGVPATAKQVRVNVTVFNPSGKGNLRFYPGTVTAAPSGILRFERNATRTETFTLPLSPNGTLTILPFVSGKGTVHGVVEVTGYAN